MKAAGEEICCGEVEDGVSVGGLWAKVDGSVSWSKVKLDLCPGVKRGIWANLLCIQSFQDAEKLNLKIFPQQTLRDNFLGLYDSHSLQHPQMCVLHLLANARVNGITQTQLAKQLHIDANNFHYVLRSLECQGLIVKHCH